jgi:hypothetical protein
MIGRHPGLYAFPELNLFVADRIYPEARFPHLTRHPVTAIESMRKCQASLSPQGPALWNDAGLRE